MKIYEGALGKQEEVVEREAIKLEVGYNVIIQKSLPLKSKYPGSFTVSITIWDIPVGRALLDLGANINLMLLSIMKRIGNLEDNPPG